MLGSAEVTAYDLRFRLLAVPVRVHPLFWLIMLILSGEERNLGAAAVFIACAFISILAHEFGHGLAGRLMGDEPSEIVLYSMGGYCAFQQYRLRRWPKIIMILSGPGAGFLLMGLVLAWARVVHGISPMDAMAIIGVGDRDAISAVVKLPPSLVARYAFFFLLQINFWWGVFNLLPIWPLDGGRIAEELLGTVNPREATRRGHAVSLITAGLIALWLASQEQYLMALWLGYFGYINYQMLQTLHRESRYAEAGDWWRR